MQPIGDRAYDPERHCRRSIRLKGYDYSQSGAYFVTIIAQNRMCLFGEVVDGLMQLNDAGRMIATEWRALPTRFPTVQFDAFVAMPNHIHSIIVINPVVPSPTGQPVISGQPTMPGQPAIPGQPAMSAIPGQPQGLPLRWGMWWGPTNR